MNDTEKVPIVKNWLWRVALQFIQTIMTLEQEACKTVERLFDTPSEKYKPQYTETILLLQNCKLIRHSEKSAEEWIGRM